MKIILLFLSFFALNAGAVDYPPDRTLDVTVMPVLGRPGYLSPITDPVFNTTVIRVSDQGAPFNSSQQRLSQIYAKNQPWNSDGTRVMLNWSYPAAVLDGTTFAFRRWVNQPSESMWLNTDPRYTIGVSGNSLVRLEVDADITSTLKVFSEYDSITLGDYEGNLSRDDKWMAMIGKKGANREIFVYDMVNQVVTARLNFGNGTINNTAMSQSGNYVTVQWGVDGSGNRQGIEVFDRSLNRLRQVSVRGGTHHDLGYDANGQEVIVVTSDTSAALNMRRLSDGVTTELIPAEKMSYNIHISCRNINRPGWAYISEFRGDVDVVRANTQLVMAVKLDGSGTVENFAHEHRSDVYAYERAAMAVPNRDGSKVMFASDWGDGSAPIYAYVAYQPQPVQNAAPTIALSAPSTATVANPISLSATAADSDGSIAKVEFFIGLTLLATDTASPYTASWTPSTAGSYQVTAKATDNLGVSTVSTATTVNVAPVPAPAGSVSLTVAGAPNLPYNGTSTSVTVGFTTGTPTKVELSRDGLAPFAIWPTDSFFTLAADGRSLTASWCITASCWGNVSGAHVLKAVTTYSNGTTAVASITLNVADASSATPIAGLLPAFPGAQGFGAETIGGRGGKVIAVTTLADDGPGSLRAALLTPEPRIVVFRVGGTITLKSRIELKSQHAFLTLAGQTAPGDGIQVKGFDLVINGSHDIVIRYMRFRPGETAPQDWSKFVLLIYGEAEATKSYNIVIDHSSLYWAPDDGAAVYGYVDNVTWQWNISEGIAHDNCSLLGPNPTYEQCHFEDSKSYIIATDLGKGATQKNITIHHNYMANTAQRNPMIASDGPHHLVNNVIYNWRDFGTEIQNRGAGTKINIIGNIYKRGPESSRDRYAIGLGGDVRNPNGYVFVRDNIGPFRPDASVNDWAIVGNGYDASAFWLIALANNYQRLTPWEQSPVPVIISQSGDVISQVLYGVGATRPVRDALDQRVIRDFYDGVGRIKKASESQYTIYPTLAGGTALLDTDGDGMPDEWEILYGFDPNDPSDGKKDANGDGYTNVEEYLNGTVPIKPVNTPNNCPVTT
jgi:pectate lyase